MRFSLKHITGRRGIIILLLLLALFSCDLEAIKKATKKGKEKIEPYNVTASIETNPVRDWGDAADDPAVWVNPDDPGSSLIIGSNKQRGLLVYDLNGKEVFSYDCGRVNNVDVRNGFPLGNEKIGIAAASNRSGNLITVVRIMPSGELMDISSGPIQSNLNEVYGFCLYHDQREDKFYAFVNGKDGGVEQWLLFDDGKGRIDATTVRTFDVGSQTEGCVADDELGFFYIGEENRGIWKYPASPEGGNERMQVDDVSSRYLKADIEGLTLYYGREGKGYLIASSQGNNTFAVYEREGDNHYLGSFTIVSGEIDRVQETDGIDVCSSSLGENFPYGVFVAQDGRNKTNKSEENQNFKLVPWEEIARAFKPELMMRGE